MVLLCLLDGDQNGKGKDEDYAVKGDDSMNSGERLSVGSPDGALSKSAVLNLEIKRVEVTLVDPISSPILS